MSDKVGKSNTSASGPYMGTRARTQTSKSADTSVEPSAGPKSHTQTSAETSVEPSSRSIRRRKKVKAKRQSIPKSNVEPITTFASAAVTTRTSSSSTIGLDRKNTASLGKPRTFTEAEALTCKEAEATTSTAEAAGISKAMVTRSAGASHIENKNAGKKAKISTEAEATTSTARAAKFLPWMATYTVRAVETLPWKEISTADAAGTLPLKATPTAGAAGTLPSKATPTAGTTGTLPRKATTTAGAAETLPRKATPTAGGTGAMFSKATTTPGAARTLTRKEISTAESAGALPSKATPTAGAAGTLPSKAMPTAGAAGTLPSKETPTTSTGASHKNAGKTNTTADKPYKSRLNYKKSKNRPDNMSIMEYLEKLKLENAPDDVMRLEVAYFHHDFNMRSISKPTLGIPLSNADIYRNTMAFNTARSFANHICSLEEGIQYRELHQAGLIDRTLSPSVLDEEYPNSSSDEESETWSDVVEELRDQARQKRFAELNAPLPPIIRDDGPEATQEQIDELDAGYCGH